MPHRKSFWPSLRIVMLLLGTFCPNRGKKLEKWAKSGNISDNELTSICGRLTRSCGNRRGWGLPRVRPRRDLVAAGGLPPLLLRHVHGLARLPHGALLGQRRQHVLVLS